MTRWLARPDRRDGFLILLGALCVLLGYSYGVATPTATVRAALHTATEFVPLRVLGALWIVAGVVAIGSAFTTRAVTGFTAAVFMPVVWAAAYLVSWLHGDSGRGWVTGALFLFLAGAVYCVAGLIDPTPIVRRRRGEP